MNMDTRVPDPRHTNMILIGGWSMIIFAILFIGITLLIDTLAQGQSMLYGMEQHNLFKVAAGTNSIRVLLIIYALLPLLLIPAAVGSFYTFIHLHEANMRVGMYFATAGALALSLSLMMLPSLNWHLVSYINTLPTANQSQTIILLQAIHSYFGVFVGDILGFGCLLVWFYITSFVMLRSDVMPHIVGLMQLIIAICGTLILAFRYTGLVSNLHVNIQAPAVFALWLFMCGIALVSLRKA
jgi:hypothetical protein